MTFQEVTALSFSFELAAPLDRTRELNEFFNAIGGEGSTLDFTVSTTIELFLGKSRLLAFPQKILTLFRGISCKESRIF